MADNTRYLHRDLVAVYDETRAILDLVSVLFERSYDLPNEWNEWDRSTDVVRTLLRIEERLPAATALLKTLAKTLRIAHDHLKLPPTLLADAIGQRNADSAHAGAIAWAQSLFATVVAGDDFYDPAILREAYRTPMACWQFWKMRKSRLVESADTKDQLLTLMSMELVAAGKFYGDDETRGDLWEPWTPAPVPFHVPLVDFQWRGMEYFAHQLVDCQNEMGAPPNPECYETLWQDAHKLSDDPTNPLADPPTDPLAEALLGQKHADFSDAFGYVERISKLWGVSVESCKRIDNNDIPYASSDRRALFAAARRELQLMAFRHRLVGQSDDFSWATTSTASGAASISKDDEVKACEELQAAFAELMKVSRNSGYHDSGVRSALRAFQECLAKPATRAILDRVEEDQYDLLVFEVELYPDFRDDKERKAWLYLQALQAGVLRRFHGASATAPPAPTDDDCTEAVINMLRESKANPPPPPPSVALPLLGNINGVEPLFKRAEETTPEAVSTEAESLPSPDGETERSKPGEPLEPYAQGNWLGLAPVLSDAPEPKKARGARAKLVAQVREHAQFLGMVTKTIPGPNNSKMVLPIEWVWVADTFKKLRKPDTNDADAVKTFCYLPEPPPANYFCRSCETIHQLSGPVESRVCPVNRVNSLVNQTAKHLLRQ